MDLGLGRTASEFGRAKPACPGTRARQKETEGKDIGKYVFPHVSSESYSKKISRQILVLF